MKRCRTTRSLWHRLLFFSALCVVLNSAAQAALNISSCSINNSSLAFGLYNPLSAIALTNNAGSVQITCQTNGTGTTPVSAQLSSGSGVYSNRTLRSGVNILKYNVYIDSAFTTIWGDGTAGSTTQSATLTRGNGSASWVLYGRIPAAQTNAPAGIYTDILQVTITW